MNVEICQYYEHFLSIRFSTEQEIVDFLSKSSACRKYMIETLKEEVNTIVIEKLEFEYRDVFKLIAVFCSAK